MKPQERWHQLIASYQIGQISDEDFTELEEVLRTTPEARKLFHRASRVDSRLRREAENSEGEQGNTPQDVRTAPIPITSWANFRTRPFLGGAAAAASVVLLSAITWTIASQPKVIATLVSGENASWESSLPTEPGSQLTAGRMKLTSGIATIRFRSGTEMMLEAPAKLSLKTPMLAKLFTGVAVLNVPETAVGFVLETPEGRVVDHGTSFAVSVDKEGRHSDFEVIEGEITVHHPATGKEVRLTGEQGACITDGAILTYDGPLPEKEISSPAKVLRIGTQGRSQSVIRANLKKWLHPEMLLVKRKNTPSNHERRSFFSFDLKGVDLDVVASAQMRLNQVPSGIGLASRLPKISDIAVYGLTNPEKADWKMETTWEEAPAAKDGVFLGNLEIPRSQQRGSRFFKSDELLGFLKAHRNEVVTFILDAEVDPVTGAHVPSLVHAFASDTHPEASGPMLEFMLSH